MIKKIVAGMRWYFKSILNLHIRLLYVIFKRTSEMMPPKSACKLINFYQNFKGRDVRYSYEEKSDLYQAYDSTRKIFFSEKMRGFWLYSKGIDTRGKSILASYFINDIKFDPGDLIIDCGANYGDLYIELSNIQPEIEYISFEPSKKEHQCIKHNIPNQQHHNLALNNTSGDIELFVSSKGGDSSLIEPKQGYTEKVIIQSTTLDEFAPSIPCIKLLKLEAEGAEPEILEGAAKTLERIEYIAVDGGAERGLKEESTIELIINILLNQGYKILSMDTKTGMGRALFKNTRFKCSK